MIKDIKISIQLLRYSFHLKANLLVLAACLFIGIFCELNLIDLVNTGIGCFILIGSTIFAQLFYGLSSTKILLSSTLRKRLQTSIPSIFTAFWYFIAYTLTIILKEIQLHFHPENIGSMKLSMIILYSEMIAIALFGGIAYKKFVLSIVILYVTLISVIFIGNLGYTLWEFYSPYFTLPQFSFTVLAAIGYLFIPLSGLIQYGVSCLLYKTEISKYALGRALRKYM